MLKISFPLIRALFALLILSALSACATSGSSKTVAEKRASVIEMRQNVLSEIYEKKPDVKAQVESSSGYAVFSNVNVNFILASVGGGYGIVRDNSNGQETYMNMGEVGLGFGAGLKDFRALFVFHTKEALDFFVNRGWSFGAQADAAAKASDKGGAVGGEVIVNNVSIYQLTKSGLALQATIKGAKFWKNKSLNNQYQQSSSTTQYQQDTTQYQPATTQYQQGTTQYQPATTEYQQGTTTQYGTPYKPATTYPQVPTVSHSTPYIETDRSIVVVPDSQGVSSTYQQESGYIEQNTQVPGSQYIQQGQEYIQQGTQIPSSQYIQQGQEYIQQGTQTQGSQYIQQGQEYIDQGKKYILRGAQVPGSQYIP